MALRHYGLTFLTAAALVGVCDAALPELDDANLPSSNRTIQVRFEPPASVPNADPDQPNPNAGLTYKRYTVNFYENGHSTVLATTPFVDIYDPDHGGHPTPIKELLDHIVWSPQRDFAILEKEKWPPSKGPTYRKVVSLETSSPWQFEDFRLDDAPLVWEDRYRVAGNWHEGCRAAVAEFDGRSGKTQWLSTPASPIGYALAPSTPDRIVMRKILDGCATAQDRATFVPDCMVLNVQFMRREITSCP